MEKIAFITLAVPGKSILKVLLMANSLRSFGGALKESPVWVLVPEEMNDFPEFVQEALAGLKVTVVPFEIPSQRFRFPFATKITAAAYAENHLRGGFNKVVWLDCDTIILREPDEFLLPDDMVLGYRPVHHKLIGPTWGETLDPFWSFIYQACEVPEQRKFQMTTHTGEKTWPYFNAGTFVVDPERQIMAKWQRTFEEWSGKAAARAFYEVDERYLIFMHQAIFTGVLLHELAADEMIELSSRINYPLHLHHDIPPELRPVNLDDLITVRYENTFEKPDWHKKVAILQPLQSWLQAQALLQNKLESPSAN